MQTSGEKLTIAEFATRAGCSTQRIYQLLHNSLQEFTIVENGRKYILSDGLPIVLEARKKQGFTKSNSADSPTLDKSLQESETAEKVAELTAELEKAKQANTAQTLTIERLTGNCERMRQTAEQDRQKAATADAERKRADAAEQQCAVKDRQLEAMQKQLDTLTAALQAEQAHAATLATALTQQQALNAGQIRLAMLDSDGSGKPAEDQTEPTKSAAGQSETVQQERKKGFLSRIFKRRKSTK